MQVAKVIAGYRRDKKLSVRKLAKEIGIPYGVLWTLENGGDETTEHWPAIIRWLFSK